jgi:hypothetical protein
LLTALEGQGGSSSSSGALPPVQGGSASSSGAPPIAEGRANAKAKAKAVGGPAIHPRGEIANVPFGPFSLSPLSRWVGGEKIHVGWGANCHRHSNSGDAPHNKCQIQVTYGTGPRAISDEECRRLAKCWLILGRGVDESSDEARTQHVFGVRPRRDAPPDWSHERLDDLVRE